MMRSSTVLLALICAAASVAHEKRAEAVGLQRANRCCRCAE
jgi:hypothetical protein